MAEDKVNKLTFSNCSVPPWENGKPLSKVDPTGNEAEFSAVMYHDPTEAHTFRLIRQEDGTWLDVMRGWIFTVEPTETGFQITRIFPEGEQL